jgi:hypothetical protein
MYYLPSGFILVRIYKAITNPFYLLYLLPYFKLPVLLPTWGLKQKKLKSVLPHPSTSQENIGLRGPTEVVDCLGSAWPLKLAMKGAT